MSHLQKHLHQKKKDFSVLKLQVVIMSFIFTLFVVGIAVINGQYDNCTQQWNECNMDMSYCAPIAQAYYNACLPILNRSYSGNDNNNALINYFVCTTA